jgi:hypothetical protein
VADRVSPVLFGRVHPANEQPRTCSRRSPTRTGPCDVSRLSSLFLRAHLSSPLKYVNRPE